MMMTLKKTAFVTLITLFAFSLLQCAGTKKIDTQVPFTLGEVYYQDWTAGVAGGGSGFNMVIPIKTNPDNIVLETVYFQGREVKLELKNNTLFIGRFYRNTNKAQDIILSSDPRAEYGNKVPELTKKIPFELKDNACVITYTIHGKLRYFKIDNVVKKETVHYPKVQPKD